MASSDLESKRVSVPTRGSFPVICVVSVRSSQRGPGHGSRGRGRVERHGVESRLGGRSSGAKGRVGAGAQAPGWGGIWGLRVGGNTWGSGLGGIQG